MRRKQAEAKPKRIRVAKEPMAEGLSGPAHKGIFTEQEMRIIRQERERLIPTGAKDGEIAREISPKLRRSVGTVREKIRRMVLDGDLPPNPNRAKRADESEKGRIKRLRQRLIKEGKTDTDIAREHAKVSGRPFKSVQGMILDLVRDGELPPNPNRLEFVKMTEEDVESMIRLRQRLIRSGLNDGEIARRISPKLKRSEAVVREKIRKLVNKGDLPPNPNKRRRMDGSELQELIRFRERLMQEGKRDTDIARAFSAQSGWTLKMVEDKLRRLVTRGTIPPNPNKREDFSEEEVARIKREYTRLAGTGKNNSDISKELAKRIRRTVNSIQCKLRGLKLAGEIEENPNKERPYTDAEVEEIIRRREELIREGLSDYEIGRRLSVLFGRKFYALAHKIKGLVDQGKAIENPNALKRYSDGDIGRIMSIREEGIRLGLNDTDISHWISDDIGRPAKSIAAHIQHMRMRGEIPKNPNGRRKRESGFFTRMSDPELIAYAISVIEEKGIMMRSELEKADRGLYHTINSRGLMDDVFRGIELSGDAEALRDVVKALGEFQ